MLIAYDLTTLTVMYLLSCLSVTVVKANRLTMLNRLKMTIKTRNRVS